MDWWSATYTHILLMTAAVLLTYGRGMWTAFCALLALAGEPPPPAPAGHTAVVDDAALRLDRGQATEAVALLLRHARHGELAVDERRAAADVLVRAADVLAARGELKGAAVAADAAFTLAPDVGDRPTLSRYVLALALAIVDTDEAGARALADRAVVIDEGSVEGRALAARLAGTDSWVSGHLTLGAGVGLWITSVAGFVVAADRDRLIRSATDGDVDGLALERDVATGVMWTAAAAAAVTSGIGLALIFAHDPGPDPAWPHPFPALPSSTSTPTTPTRNPS
jgi:hypothetical protein